MAWTTPRTYTTGELVTAAMLNTHIRDNMLQTVPAKATAAGDLFVGTAANAIKRFALSSAGSLLKVNAEANDVEWKTLGSPGQALLTNSLGTDLEWGGVGVVADVDYTSNIAADTEVDVDVALGFAPKVIIAFLGGSNGYGQVTMWCGPGLVNISGSFVYRKENGLDVSRFTYGTTGSGTTNSSEQFGPYIWCEFVTASGNNARVILHNVDETSAHKADLHGVIWAI